MNRNAIRLSVRPNFNWRLTKVTNAYIRFSLSSVFSIPIFVNSIIINVEKKEKRNSMNDRRRVVYTDVHGIIVFAFAHINSIRN